MSETRPEKGPLAKLYRPIRSSHPRLIGLFVYGIAIVAGGAMEMAATTTMAAEVSETDQLTTGDVEEQPSFD